MNAITRRSLILSGAALASGALLAPAEAATGSVSISDRQRRLHLRRFHRQRHPPLPGDGLWLRIGGISAGATIGASGTDLVGTASHLHQPADIEGIYSAVGAGLSVAGGRSAAQLTNARGVVLRLHGRQMGLMFSIDLSGMSIALG